ncbi:MAG TPA: 2OG-Fe(II) oxygenase [Cytophagaceae bacterium]|jgi:Rps23 Pro-64 3,4-dihydroxylase Tpa1-like proline 4-hydroxylase|nr:2OG-Fe(II) oxygenase [Cytophagaceae bacterium]
MEEDFELLINSYIESNVGIAEHFLSTALAQHLKNNLIALHEKKMLIAAKVGNEGKLTEDKSVRSDSIYWLDRKHNNQYENDFFDRIDAFIVYLNNSCYTGITGYEFHYALYEKGSFYKKHKDQFQNNQNREYSLISYLNEDWLKSDGGELLIHQTGKNQTIAPTNGKTVFFKSNELEHEVLLTNQTRMSITGWLKRESV